MPTGGISLANCASYLASPIVAACGGTWIAKSDVIAAGRFADIAKNARKAVAATRA